MCTITDWLMVIITAIYVGATICIMRANKGATKAAEEQLAESKRQFSETKRLEIMPYFEISISDGNSNFGFDDENSPENHFNYIEACAESKSNKNLLVKDNTITVRNIGVGTARDISCTFKFQSAKDQRIDLGFISCLSGEEKSFSFDIALIEKETTGLPITFSLYYSDLLNNKYRMDFILKYSVNNKWEDEWIPQLIGHTISVPILVNKSTIT